MTDIYNICNRTYRVIDTAFLVGRKCIIRDDENIIKECEEVEIKDCNMVVPEIVCFGCFADADGENVIFDETNNTYIVFNGCFKAKGGIGGKDNVVIFLQGGNKLCLEDGNYKVNVDSGELMLSRVTTYDRGQQLKGSRCVIRDSKLVYGNLDFDEAWCVNTRFVSANGNVVRSYGGGDINLCQTVFENGEGRDLYVYTADGNINIDNIQSDTKINIECNGELSFKNGRVQGEVYIQEVCKKATVENCIIDGNLRLVEDTTLKDIEVISLYGGEKVSSLEATGLTFATARLDIKDGYNINIATIKANERLEIYGNNVNNIVISNGYIKEALIAIYEHCDTLRLENLTVDRLVVVKYASLAVELINCNVGEIIRW